MGDSKIEWTDKTWNCIRGCSLVSEGCRNCYAMRQAHRFSGEGMPYRGLTVLTPSGPKWNGDITLVPDLLGEPMRWKKPARIFVNSMSDVFHEGVDDSFIDRIFGVIMLCQQHQFQILTKRPERMMKYMNEGGRASNVMDAASREAFDQETLRHGTMPKTASWVPREEQNRLSASESLIRVSGGKWPPPNVWLGTSVENQKTADERIPLLCSTIAAVRWLSIEPLLGPVSIDVVPRSLHWVVVGGESGPGARPMHPDWARTIRDQCVRQEIPFFFKQWGDWLPIATPRMHTKIGSMLLFPDGRTAAASWNDVMGTTGSLWAVQRVGKHQAGRLLDLREWNEYPQYVSGDTP